MRQREQGRQQRQSIGLREAVLGEGLLEFGELGLRRIVSLKLQEPLQMLNDRIEGTVLVIGRAAKLDAGSALG